MNLTQAIETLEYHEPSLTQDQPPQIRKALTLVIAASKALQNARSLVGRKSYRLLPAETEE